MADSLITDGATTETGTARIEVDGATGDRTGTISPVGEVFRDIARGGIAGIRSASSWPASAAGSSCASPRSSTRTRSAA